MKPWKVILAVLITLALLYVARRASMRNVPETLASTTMDQTTLTHICKHIYKGDLTPAQLDVAVTGGLLPDNSLLVLHYHLRASEAGDDREGKWIKVDAVPVPGEGLTYRVSVPNQGRGKEFIYYWQVERESGEVLATLPPNPEEARETPLWFRFEGARSIPLLIAHIACMFGAFLLMVMAFITACEDVTKKDVAGRMGKQVLWATVILFLGTFPIGMWLEYQVYATYWTGIPIGRDITDSKSLIIFLYWIVLLLLLKGSAFASDPTKDVVTVKTSRVLTMAGVILSLAAYLVPHGSGSF